MAKDKAHIFYLYSDNSETNSELNLEPIILNYVAPKVDGEDTLKGIFEDIRRQLNFHFDKIISCLKSKPDKVFQISSDLDTILIREQVSNLNQTCFYENGRIFAYSNFINEVVFGIENWVEVESETTQALTLLLVNNQITFDDLRQFVKGDVYEIYDNLISLLFKNQDFLRFFDIFIQNRVMHVIPRENLINNLLDYKRTLSH